MNTLPKQVDVAVLGTHPSASFAVLLLAEAGIKAVQIELPATRVERRAVTISPETFQLHPLLKGWDKKLKLWPGHGLRFLGDAPGESIATSASKPVTFVGELANVSAALAKLCKSQKLGCLSPHEFAVESIDERGVTLRLDQNRLAVQALLVADEPSSDVVRALNIHVAAEHERPREVSLLTLPASAKLKLGAPATLPIGLGLAGSSAWAWALPADGGAELTILHSPERVVDTTLMTRWLAVLEQHDVVTLSPAELKAATASTFHLPAAGALHGETVANRTLLIGPAGGFITACGEEIYPSLWSAKLAVEHLQQVFGKSFIQDGLARFPQTWGATLGDYLRGPQQNLKFLLPLVFRNAVMAQRLADAILTGKSVVR